MSTSKEPPIVLLPPEAADAVDLSYVGGHFLGHPGKHLHVELTVNNDLIETFLISVEHGPLPDALIKIRLLEWATHVVSYGVETVAFETEYAPGKHDWINYLPWFYWRKPVDQGSGAKEGEVKGRAVIREYDVKFFEASEDGFYKLTIAVSLSCGPLVMLVASPDAFLKRIKCVGYPAEYPPAPPEIRRLKINDSTTER